MSPRPRIDAVLLDIDDTLVDTRRAFFAAVHAVAGIWLGHLGPGGPDEAARRWIADVGGHFRTFTRGEISIVEQRRRRVADLHETFGGSLLDDEQFAEWEADYDRAFRAAWTLHPDAIPLLDDLAAVGVRVGALSNSTRELSLAKLAALGLEGRLPLLASPDDLGFGKPDPRVFRLACERAGTSPSHTAYVGDELDVDARGARAAGLVGVWLDRRRASMPGGPDRIEVAGTTDEVLVAASLRDVPELLDLGGLPTRR